MKWGNYSLSLLLASAIITTCYCSKMLVFMPMCSKSHKIGLDPLMKSLAEKGHEITEVTSIKTTKTHANIRSIYLESVYKVFLKIQEEASMSNGSSLAMLTQGSKHISDGVNYLMQDPVFKEFMKNTGKYDVIITSTIMNDVSFILLSILFPDTPLILFSPSSLFPYIAWEHNVPYPLSYIPVALLPYNSDMTFFQRVINVLATKGFELLMKYLISPAAANAIQIYLPDHKLPNPRDVEKSASLILVNSHFSLTGIKPSLPGVVEVGGMHCSPPAPLPEEFSKFVDGAGDNGFIVFSLGSVVQAKFMPKILIDSFKAAFKEISPVRVIWKYEEQLEDISSNVMISKWIPQQDLIGHPKCRLAITHGGLMSLQEANYHGVPILGVPLGLDRDNNLYLAVTKGIAKTIDKANMSPEIVTETMKLMLFNNSFKENAEKFSKLMKDRPQHPVETAAYWVEYVLRHEGAAHLRCPAEKLNFFQYFLIDVFAFIFGVILIFLFVVYFVLRTCYRTLFSRKRKPKFD